MTSGMIYAYNIVMTQVNSMEDFYGHLDKYVSESMSPTNSVDNPYIPKPISEMRQPVQNTTFISH
jgi:hypothetical protein